MAGSVTAAVVGCGQIADAHLRQLAAIEGVEVVAVCDRDPHLAEQAALRFAIPRRYTDVATMLREARPAAVHVASPPATHLPIGRMALEHGSHLFVEKPFTVDLAEAEALAGAAERAGRLVCVGHTYLYDETFRRLLDAAGGGRIGEVTRVDLIMGYDLTGPFGGLSMKEPDHWVHRLPGGIAQNNLVHPLALALAFVRDAEPRLEVSAWRYRSETYGDRRDLFPDLVDVRLAGATVTASITFSCWVRPLGIDMTVRGSRGQLRGTFESGTVQAVDEPTWPGPLRQVQVARAAAREARREYRWRLGRALRGAGGYFDGMRTLFERFYAAVQGTGPLPIPLDETLRVVAITDRIFAHPAQTPPA